MLDFKLGCCIQFDESGNELQRYATLDENDFFEFLIKDLRNRKKRIIYFHNLSFDSKFFLLRLQDHFPDVAIIKNGSRVISVKCFVFRTRGTKKQRKCLLEFRDSLSLLISSIQTLGKVVKLPKLEFDFDYENLQQAEQYCYRDCEIIIRSIFALLRVCNQQLNYNLLLHKIPLTCAALSKKIFQNLYPKVYYQTDLYLEKTLREYYFGGRVEAFNFNALQPAFYCDINSHYPNTMKREKFAIGKTYRFYTDVIDFSRSETILAYECEIIEQQQYPIYPQRTNSRVYFANGRKKVLITRKEYEYFVKHKMLGNEITIVSVICEFFAKDVTNFAEFIDPLYELRFNDESNEYFYKILLNSSYGKFGEHPMRETMVLCTYNPEAPLRTEIEDINGILLEKKPVFRRYLQINLMNACLVTSYARFRLWQFMMKGVKAGVDIYYCDTDSVVVSDPMFLAKYLQPGLGNMKVEAKFDLFQAIDSKEYFSIYNGEFAAKFKGLRKKGGKSALTSIESIQEHITEGTKTNMVGSVFYCMRRKSIPATVHIITKHKRSFFTKREILPDLTTKPLENFNHLDDIEKKNKFLILKQIFSQ